MKTSVYLVQRLNEPINYNNPFSFGGGLLNGGISKEGMQALEALFSFDYMGSAEFEWGAVPMALDTLVKSELTTFEIDNKVWGICTEDIKNDVVDWIKNAMVNHVSLKEWLGLQEALKGEKYARTKGWLKIEDNNYCEEPFMFFVDKQMFDNVCKLFEVK